MNSTPDKPLANQELYHFHIIPSMFIEMKNSNKSTGHSSFQKSSLPDPFFF
jgi:hypothetical protein